MTMITRVGFCPKCFKRGQPKSRSRFIAYGGTSKACKIIDVSKSGWTGFTPHIYESIMDDQGIMYFTKICAMIGCGAYSAKCKEDGISYIYLRKVKEDSMSLYDWNALCLFKDTGFKL